MSGFYPFFVLIYIYVHLPSRFIKFYFTPKKKKKKKKN